MPVALRSDRRADRLGGSRPSGQGVRLGRPTRLPAAVRERITTKKVEDASLTPIAADLNGDGTPDRAGRQTAASVQPCGRVGLGCDRRGLSIGTVSPRHPGECSTESASEASVYQPSVPRNSQSVLRIKPN